MENLKLTAQIAAAYPNAKVDTSVYVCKVVGLSYDTDELVLRATGGSCTDAFIHPAKDCRLLLFSLSSITDEDAIEVAKIINFLNSEVIGCEAKRYQRVNQIECGRGIAEYLHSGRMYNNTTMHWSRMLSIIDFLRSKSYALPFMGIDLITAGIAIVK